MIFDYQNEKKNEKGKSAIQQNCVTTKEKRKGGQKVATTATASARSER